MYGFYVSPDGNWTCNGGNMGGDIIPAPPGEWHHLAFVQDGNSNASLCYVDLEEVRSDSASSNETSGRPFFIGAAGTDLNIYEGFGGLISDVRIYNEALTGDALAATTIPITSPGLADNPQPNDKATDLPRDVTLSWAPGEFANTHDVYFGTDFDDVNDATKASPEYQTTKSLGDESYDLGTLDFGTTYYWRIDEVNAPPPQSAVFKGEVWQFTTEPIGYPIADITATASSTEAGQDPENTVNGSGMDANDLHSNESASMWLSEVRFLYIPGWAREPDPQDGATGVHPDVILKWRPGREAATHDVYLNTDEQGVMDGNVPANTVTEASYDAGTLELGETYHWRVDEANAAGIPAIWQGDICSFTTADYIVVDNFESYNGLEPSDPQSNRIFMMWKDGIGYGAQDNPPYSAGNGTGSIIGHAAPPFVEGQIIHGGKQSMPYFYDDRGLSGKANYSEAEVDISELGIGPNWTRAGVKTLTLYFYGDPANSAGEQMYVKINGVEVLYDGASSDITHGIWQPWNIDLSSLAGIDLQNVTRFIIGLKNGGGSGVVYFDDIRLYPAIEIPDSQAPNDSALVAHWDFEGDFTDATGKGHAELGGSTDYVDEFYGFYVSPGNTWNVNSGGVWDDSQRAAGGQWHHLAFVQDGPAGEGHFYINGELIISGGAESCDTTGRPLFIGAAGTDVVGSVFESFKGRIDDVRIYDYALSQLEIQYLALD